MTANTTSTDANADAQALRAALSTINDWDSELSMLFGIDTSSPSSSDDQQKKAKAKAKTTKDRRPYRETRVTRREEIAALKAHVEELQYQVALKKAPGDTLLTKADALKQAELEDKWMEQASSQQKLLFAAEMENANLRRRTEFQQRIAKQIDKMVKRLAQLEAALGVPREISFAYYSGPRIDPLAHLKRLDSMVADTDKIFSADRFSQGSHPCFHEMYFRDETPADVGVEFEYRAVWMLPFAVGRVVDALWMQTTRPAFERKKHAYKDIYHSTHAMVSQVIATPAVNDGWGPCHHQAAACRISTSDGSYFIVSKTLGRGINGMQWHGTSNFESWLHIERVPTPARSSAITTVKFYRRTLLQLPEEAGFSRAQRSKWAQQFLTSHAQNRFQNELDWTLQVLDNLLLTPDAAAQRLNSPQGITVQPSTVSV